MKTTHSLDELKKIAKSYFRQYGVKKLYATTDGQIFLNAGRAAMHAGKGEVYPIDRDGDETEVKSLPSTKPIPVAKLQEELQKMTDTAQLQQMHADETAGANRATALRAIEK